MAATTQEAQTVFERSWDERPSNSEVDTYNDIERQFTAENIAKIQSELEEYRNEANKKNVLYLSTEKHSSELLGKYLRADGWSKPGAGWAAHHMISGSHKKAVPSRLVLAKKKVKIRIDDADNGCWMPDEKLCAHRTIYPNAVPHANIHRTKYYSWLNGLLRNAKTKIAVQGILSTVRTQLLEGNIKKELLQEIEDSRYKNTIKKMSR